MSIRILIMLIPLVVPQITYANTTAEELIRYRQSAMTLMRWNIKNIKRQLKQPPANYDKPQLRASADAIVAIANTNIAALFAPGTETGKGWKDTRAKARLFEQMGKFNEHLSALREEAKRFSLRVDTNEFERLDEHYDQLFKVCRSCHSKYRRKL